MTEAKKVLCVEDDTDCCELLQFILSNEGFEVVTCTESRKALILAEQEKFSAILLDHRLAEISGVRKAVKSELTISRHQLYFIPLRHFLNKKRRD